MNLGLIAAVAGGGASAAAPEEPPATPNLSFANVTDTGFDVTLTCDDTETSVTVEYAVGSASWPGTSVSMSDQGGGVWTGAVSGQAPGTTIYLRGSATNGGGESAYDEDSQLLLEPPAAPSNLSSPSQTSSSISLSWTDNSGNETAFELEYSLAGMNSWALVGGASQSANATSAEATSLASETAYDFRIRATNPDGNSSYATLDNISTTA